MDKRKVLLAYRKGFITMHECAQILGIDSAQVLHFMNEAHSLANNSIERLEQKSAISQ